MSLDFQKQDTQEIGYVRGDVTKTKYRRGQELEEDCPEG